MYIVYLHRTYSTGMYHHPRHKELRSTVGALRYQTLRNINNMYLAKKLNIAQEILFDFQNTSLLKT